MEKNLAHHWCQQGGFSALPSASSTASLAAMSSVRLAARLVEGYMQITCIEIHTFIDVYFVHIRIYIYTYIPVWDIYRNKYTYKMHLEYIIYTVLYSTGILEIGGWHHEWRLSLVSRLCATLILKFSSETLWDQLGNPINPRVWSCYGEFRVPIIKFRGQLVGATAEITIVVVVTGTKPFWPQSSINLYIIYIYQW